MRRGMILLVSLLSVCLLVSCSVLSDGPARLSELGERYGEDLGGGKMIFDKDTHGGFLGDGERLTRFRYADGRLASGLPENERWKPLPAGDELTELLTESGLELAAEVLAAEGYYCLWDRQTGECGPGAESGLFGRPSFNFTLFVYDTAADVLTVYELDT